MKIRSSTVVKSRATIPQEWSQVQRADPLTVVHVSVALVQHRAAELEHALLEGSLSCLKKFPFLFLSCAKTQPLTEAVSDPSHHRYGKHLTALEVDELVRPDKESTDAVMAWLAQCDGLNLSQLSTSPAGDWLYFPAPIFALESLLATEYFMYRHSGDGETRIRSPQWSLPHHVADHIELIDPTTAFLRPRTQSRYGAPEPEWEREGRMPTYEELVEEDLVERGKIKIPSEDDLSAEPTALEACNRLAISPLCLRVLYGTFGYSVQSQSGNKIGIVNFLGETANRSDAQRFLELYRPDAAATGAAESFEIQLVAGGEDPQGTSTPEQLEKHQGMEGALDAQYALGISWPIPLVTYNVGGLGPFRPVHDHEHAVNRNEPYLAWLQHMKTLPDPPSVVSISYAEDEKTVPPEYARRVCAEFAQLGARGVSILVASGDFGVGRTEHCFASSDGDRSGNGDNKPRFMPSFPASCPYVTAVGATRFIEPEIVGFDARSDFSSGGGFSDVFAAPDYQNTAVRGYLSKLGGQYAGLFDPAGRAYPDVAAMGYHFAVVYNGVAEMQDGTSASAPTVAAIVALLNNERRAQGLPAMGFLNPWIYAGGHRAFTDVTLGSNLGCNTSGFPATEGWDPATGFGTPVRSPFSITFLRSPFSCPSISLVQKAWPS